MAKNQIRWNKIEEPFATFWTYKHYVISLSRQDPTYPGKWMVMHNFGLQPAPFKTKEQAMNYINNWKKEVLK